MPETFETLRIIPKADELNPNLLSVFSEIFQFSDCIHDRYFWSAFIFPYPVCENVQAQWLWLLGPPAIIVKFSLILVEYVRQAKIDFGFCISIALLSFLHHRYKARRALF